jgi:hypothetical protein
MLTSPRTPLCERSSRLCLSLSEKWAIILPVIISARSYRFVIVSLRDILPGRIFCLFLCSTVLGSPCACLSARRLVCVRLCVLASRCELNLCARLKYRYFYFLYMIAYCCLCFVCTCFSGSITLKLTRDLKWEYQRWCDSLNNPMIVSIICHYSWSDQIVRATAASLVSLFVV